MSKFEEYLEAVKGPKISKSKDQIKQGRANKPWSKVGPGDKIEVDSFQGEFQPATIIKVIREHVNRNKPKRVEIKMKDGRGTVAEYNDDTGRWQEID